VNLRNPASAVASATFLCPTCFCFDIVDEAQRNERIRNWIFMFRIYSLKPQGITRAPRVPNARANA
jgi:hypothetical protein